MTLVFDVGNSETTIGLFDGETLRGQWRIMTGVSRTADEFGILLRSLVGEAGCQPSQIDGVAIGSVVPPVTGPLSEACAKYFPKSATVNIDGASPLPIRLQADE